MEGKPSWRTIYDWLEKDAELSTRFARARELGGDAIFEETLEIADSPNFGIKEVIGKDGSVITREDMLGHRKLQVETRFKLLSKWNPKKYGDRTIMSGDKENPVEKRNSDSDVCNFARSRRKIMVLRFRSPV